MFLKWLILSDNSPSLIMTHRDVNIEPKCTEATQYWYPPLNHDAVFELLSFSEISTTNKNKCDSWSRRMFKCFILASIRRTHAFRTKENLHDSTHTVIECNGCIMTVAPASVSSKYWQTCLLEMLWIFQRTRSHAHIVLWLGLRAPAAQWTM